MLMRPYERGSSYAIYVLNVVLSSHIWSRPTGARGLKSDTLSQLIRTAFIVASHRVASHRGAWIEIKINTALIYTAPLSRPTGARGLK